MQIGKYKLTVINTGYFKLDGNAMVGIIPRALTVTKTEKGYKAENIYNEF